MSLVTEKQIKHAASRATGNRLGIVLSVLWAWLLALPLLWPASAAAAASTHCASLSATVTRGGSVDIDVSSCDGPYNTGMSGPIAPFAAHGTVIIGLNSASQTVTYAHSGDSATSDVFALEDEDLGVVTVTITVTAPAAAIAVSPAGLPTMTAGAPYSQSLSSSGGSTPHTYSLASGTLPPGLTLGAGGLLSGTPTYRGTYAFTVRSRDAVDTTADKGYAGTVQNPTLSLTASEGAAIQGVAFSQTLGGSGGVAPYEFALESGALPAGIAISIAGVVSGSTAAAAGSYPVTLRVTDSSTGTGRYFELESYALTVSAAPAVSISVSPAAVSEDGATNLTYTVTRSLNLASSTEVNITTSGTATSGTDYTGAVATVTIPAGATTATITINPAADNTVEADETVTLTVAAGTGYTVGTPSSATGTILNDDIPVTVSPASLPGATVAAAYSQSVTASGGTAPYAFAVTAGTLPAGLDLASSGALSGTPTAGGIFTFTVTATDSSPSAGPYAGTQAYSLTVGPATVALPAVTLAGATVGTAYSAATGPATGGTAPYTYAVTAGALPGGLSLTAATGAITGTPTAAGTFNFTVLATDSSSGTGPYTTSRAHAITVVSQPPVANAVNLTVAFNAAATNVPLNVTGGTAASVAVSSPPAHGTALASGTAITYQPVAGYAGPDTFTYTATNAGGTSAPAAVSVTVSAPTLALSPAGSALSATYAVAYTQAFAASGGTGPYTYAVTAGALPAGLTLASGGTLSGTPTAKGTFTFTATATDTGPTGAGAPFTVSRAYTLTVAGPTIALLPTSLPSGAVGVAYSQALTASGGIAPYGFTVSAGALPEGLALSAGGTLSGTPSASGSVTFTVRAADTNAEAGTQAYTLAVSTNPVSATTSTVVANPVVVAADGVATSVITVTVRDAGGLPVSGMTVALSQGGGASTISPAVMSDAEGVATFTVRNAKAEKITYGAAAHAVTVTQTASVNFVGTTITGSTPGGNVTATITGGTCLGFAPESTRFRASPSAPPERYFPYDVFEFGALECGATGTVTVTITYPRPIPPGARYFKLINGDWVDWTSKVKFAGNAVSLTIVDGGEGDTDPAPGTIGDPSGLSLLVLEPAVAVPTISTWAILLLSLLLLVTAAHARPERGFHRGGGA